MRLKHLLLAAVLVGAVAGGTVVSREFSQLDQPVTLDQAIFFDLEKGTSFIGLAREMERRGLIDDAFWLRLRSRVEAQLTAIQAGYYRLEPGMSPLELVRQMADGETHTWSVRFPEGWTFARLRARLAAQPNLRHTLAGVSGKEIMARLGRADDHPEGWFFPASYEYEKDDASLEVLATAHRRMNDVLNRAWANRADDLPLQSPYEALTLASIIERETPLNAEKPRIAGVFVRRLEQGMRLQTDPTVIYGMGERYAGHIGSADLNEKTPYNTYRIDGLPPTPIGMPGKAAIEAAVNPAEGDALYFVARGDGSHKFSETLEEHNRAVREFQLNRDDDYRSFPPVATDKDASNDS